MVSIVCDDDGNDRRVQMPCGHAFCGSCIVQYVRSVIDPSDHTPTYILRCLCCKVEWNWSIVREVILQLGGLSDEDFAKIENKYTDRLLHLGMGGT